MVEGGLKEIIVDGMKVTAKDDIFDLLTQVFSCKSDSTITNVHSFVCLYVTKTAQQLKSSIFHPSSLNF